METKVGPLCSQDWKIQQKEVSRHYLTPEMVPGKIRHFLVASFYCSANIYDNTCLALYTRTIPYNMYVWRTPGTVHENDTYHILNTYEYYVVLAIGAAVALPWGWVLRNFFGLEHRTSNKRHNHVIGQEGWRAQNDVRVFEFLCAGSSRGDSA